MDDHDLLIRIDERQARIEEMLDGGKETFRTHDERLRCLEQNQSRIMGTVVAVGGVITVLMNGLFWLIAKIWK